RRCNLRKHSQQLHRKNNAERFIKTHKKPLLIVIIAIAAIIIAAVIVSNVATKSGFETSFLSTRDTVKIGIRTDVDGFGSVDEYGNIIGFDREYIDAVLKELLGDREKMYEYYPLTSQDAGGTMKYGTADIAIGLLSSGLDKTKGFTLTKPYYTDDVVLVMRKDSRAQGINDVEGNTIGLLSTAVPSGDFIKHLQKIGAEKEIVRYSDYESAMLDLDAGRIPAIAIPRALSKQFVNAEYRIAADPVYEIGYSIMLPTGQKAVETEFNRAIDKLDSNGTTLTLEKKWGI
ncbi:MAG: transporter substrate-binding domain-containing protein, partial [Christensenella sp.]